MSVRASLALFRAEMGKIWRSPLFEVAIALMAFMSVTSLINIPHFLGPQSDFAIAFQSLVTSGVSGMMGSIMLPLIVLCAVLMPLSFARDYEQGLMQYILSSPVSRRSYFIVKFFAVVLPLALLSWMVTLFFVGVSYYTDLWFVAKSALYVLPVSFLFLMFCGGVGVLVSLVVKRTIPSVLLVLLTNLFLWFITTNNFKDYLGSLFDYICLTPFKGSLDFLDKLLGIDISNKFLSSEFAASLSLSGFGVLAVFWACILVIPMFVYFCRRFEVCE